MPERHLSPEAKLLASIFGPQAVAGLGEDHSDQSRPTIVIPEDEIKRHLAPLDEQERELLRLRFGLDRGEPRSREEVGEHFNLTHERVREIEERAIQKLRHPPRVMQGGGTTD